MNYIDRIKKMGACPEAVDWLREKNYKSLAMAWRYCQRGDWMLWLIARCNPTEAQHKAIVLAACDCADLAKEYRRPEDQKVLADCVRTAREWAAGKATLEEVDEAARAARAAEAATQKQCADIVRKHLKCPELEEVG